jgi:hypothetical protein
LIGGLPLLQTIAITFTGAPIPFGKINFPPPGLKAIIDKIKDAITKGKSYLSELAKDFVNPIKAELDKVNAKIREFTDNNFQGLKESLPSFFNDARAGVVAAREEMLTLLGNAQSAADQKFLGVPIGELSILGSSLYEAHKSFENHTNELSGVGRDDKTFEFQQLYGDTTFASSTVTINSGSITVSPSLTAPTYPIVNVGQIIVVNTLAKRVVGKSFTLEPTGAVSVDVVSSNTRVDSDSIVTLNLASIYLQGGGTTKLAPNMYIKVNDEIKQVNTINARGDFLTVYSPFNSSATSVSLYKETALNVNSAFASTVTGLSIKVRTPFCANSLCLDNVITGNGTTFTSYLSANDKVYYDNKEYFVISVTDTTITVDEETRALNNAVIYKVTDETFLQRFSETNGPEDIIGTFSSLDQMTSSMGGNITSDLTTRYRAANGTYVMVDAKKPTDATKSLQNAQAVNKVNRVYQDILDNFQDDAIMALTESELIQLINQTTADIERLKNELLDSIKQDLSVINAVKGLLSGLVKLFSVSCGKKKKKDNNIESDEYLDLILAPNVLRQGCSATESDFIFILDEIDAEHNEPNLPAYDITVPDYGDPESEILQPEDEFANIYPDEPEEQPSDNGDVVIDNNDPTLPAEVVDPCNQPC